jgi:hypothetical protein
LTTLAALKKFLAGNLAQQGRRHSDCHPDDKQIKPETEEKLKALLVGFPQGFA